METKNKNSKIVNKENDSELLYKKLFKWWKKLSSGGYMFIYKNGDYEMWVSNKKTKNSKINDANKFIQLKAKDKDINAIIWSSMSTDDLVFFTDYIIKKIPKLEISKILKSKKPESLLAKNFKKYFVKYKLLTNKDYTLKS